MTRRTAIGLAAVVLCGIVLAWRVRTIAREPRLEVSPRVAQLMYNRMLAQWIAAYARRYRRPAYYLDSVMAHLDSADAERVSALRTDLWGKPVHYFWSYCWFSLHSYAGARPWLRPTPAESIPAESIPPGQLFAPGGEIDEQYPWPPGVGRTERCFGGS